MLIERQHATIFWVIVMSAGQLIVFGAIVMFAGQLIVFGANSNVCRSTHSV